MSLVVAEKLLAQVCMLFYGGLFRLIDLFLLMLKRKMKVFNFKLSNAVDFCFVKVNVSRSLNHKMPFWFIVAEECQQSRETL